MAEEWRNWKHITKLDPDKKITKKAVDTIIRTGTDAIMISGTLGITKEKIKHIMKLLKGYDVPRVLEPASPKGMIYHRDIDWMFVPTVFNTDYAPYINGLHKLWLKRDHEKINWDIVVPEAYIILNPKCSAARVTKARADMSKEGVVATALAAERYFKIPVIYIEYSGTYGNPEIVKAVREALTTSHLVYGGGIRTQHQAEEMSQYATIVVGNTIYDRGSASLVNTMKGTVSQEIKNLQQRLTDLNKLRGEKKRTKAHRKLKKIKKKSERRVKRIKRKYKINNGSK